MEQVRYQVAITRDDDESFVAEVVELPGCIASGDDLEELAENLREAIEVYISTPMVRASVSGISLAQLRMVDDDHVPACVDLALA